MGKQLHHQMDSNNRVVDSENWVLAGIAFTAPLKPIFTNPIHTPEEEEATTTPTSAESRICSRLLCPPPAPKKRKSASLKCNYGGVKEFFNTPDLETIFRRRLS